MEKDLTDKKIVVKIDKSLNQFDDLILSPKKVKEANEWLQKMSDISQLRDIQDK